MSCSGKFRQQGTGDSTRVDHTEVDGRPHCTNPFCRRPLQGDGTCTRGCRQNAIAVAAQDEPCLLRDGLTALVGWPNLQIEENEAGTAFILRDTSAAGPWGARNRRVWERLGFQPEEDCVVIPVEELEHVASRLQQLWEQDGAIRWPENFSERFAITTSADDAGGWVEHADGSSTRAAEVSVGGRVRGTQVLLMLTDHAGDHIDQQWELPSEVWVELAHRLPHDLHRASGLPDVDPDDAPWELWKPVEIAIPDGLCVGGARAGRSRQIVRGLQALIVEPDEDEPLGVRLVGRTEDGERTPFSLRLAAGMMRRLALAVQEKVQGTVVEDGLTGPWTLPLAIRDVAPGPGFTRAPQAQGEGIHTGGVWVSPNGKEYWKPLDGRPYMNAEVHLPTREAECLELMLGEPGFPGNWWVEEAGEVVSGGRVYRRRWLVRSEARLLPDEDIPTSLEEHVLPIEQGLRRLNERGWTLGDRLAVACCDPTDPIARGVPFILDLSSAHPFHDPLDRSGDSGAFFRWAESCGFGGLVKLRRAGREVIDLFRVHNDPTWPQYNRDGKMVADLSYRHVYASRNRPISAAWARIPHAHYQDADDYREHRVHTWVITSEPLDEETQRAYELTWAWSPVERESQSE